MHLLLFIYSRVYFVFSLRLKLSRIAMGSMASGRRTRSSPDSICEQDLMFVSGTLFGNRKLVPVQGGPCSSRELKTHEQREYEQRQKLLK